MKIFIVFRELADGQFSTLSDINLNGKSNEFYFEVKKKGTYIFENSNEYLNIIDSEGNLIEKVNGKIRQLSEQDIKEKEDIENKQREEKTKKMQRLNNIKDVIANTIIDFKGGKFKIRKKDIGYYTGYNNYADKMNVVPIEIEDTNYKKIPMYYKDFVELGKLVGQKRTEITYKYEQGKTT